MLKKIIQTKNLDIIELFVEHGTQVDTFSKSTKVKYHCVYKVKPNTYTKTCPVSIKNENCAIFDTEIQALNHGEAYIKMIYGEISDYN